MIDVYVRLVHFAGFVLWFAGLFGMAFALQAGGKHRLAGILADIGATLTIIAGIYQAVQRHAFTQPWLHIKLAAVAILILIHVLLRRRMKSGKAGTALLLPLLIVSLGIVYVAVMKPLGK
jgi:uncharacterized membrane protein